MKKLRIVGEPTRLSALNSLTKCSGFVAMRSTEERSVSGPAADTGTATGRGQELWHRGKTLKETLKALKEECPKDFPKANMDEVGRIVTRYCNDPRNLPHYVVTKSLEQTVKVEIPCHPTDQTGQPYIAEGHMDQVRYAYPDHKDREHMGFFLWDAKNGKAEGEQMLGDYAFQLAAYHVGAAATGDYPGLLVGGIIRTKGYLSRIKDKETRKLREGKPGEHKVFFHAGWTLEDSFAIMANVAYQIGQIRQGEMPHTPGAHCRYCPLDFPSCISDNTRAKALRKAQRARKN